MAVSKQVTIPAASLGLLPLESDIFCVVGSTATKLTRPANKTGIVLIAQAGDWSVRSGDKVGSMPSAYSPVATITNGTGAFPIKEGSCVTIQAPGELTVKGYTSTDALVYYWI